MHVGTLTNARFLDIGQFRSVVAGTTKGFADKPDGETFYSEVIDTFDGELAHCGDKTYKVSRRL